MINLFPSPVFSALVFKILFLFVCPFVGLFIGAIVYMKKKFAFLLMSILLTSCSTNTEIKPSLISKDVDGYLHNGEFIFPLNTLIYYKHIHSNL